MGRTARGVQTTRGWRTAHKNHPLILYHAIYHKKPSFIYFSGLLAALYFILHVDVSKGAGMRTTARTKILGVDYTAMIAMALGIWIMTLNLLQL